MPHEVKSLSETIRAAKERIAEAPKIAAKLNQQIDDLNVALNMVDHFAEEVKANTAEVRSLLVTVGNMPPPETNPPEPPQTERTTPDASP